MTKIIIIEQFLVFSIITTFNGLTKMSKTPKKKKMQTKNRKNHDQEIILIDSIWSIS